MQTLDDLDRTLPDVHIRRVDELIRYDRTISVAICQDNLKYV